MPSLSKVAIRSATGTKYGPLSLVTRVTKLTTASGRCIIAGRACLPDGADCAVAGGFDGQTDFRIRPPSQDRRARWFRQSEWRAGVATRLNRGCRDIARVAATEQKSSILHHLLRALLSMNVLMPLAAMAFAAPFHLHPAVKITLLVISVSPTPPVLPKKSAQSRRHRSLHNRAAGRGRSSVDHRHLLVWSYLKRAQAYPLPSRGGRRPARPGRESKKGYKSATRLSRLTSTASTCSLSFPARKRSRRARASSIGAATAI